MKITPITLSFAAMLAASVPAVRAAGPAEGIATASAEALKTAFDLDLNLVHTFRSERDFDPIRHQAPFAAFELD